MCSNKNKSGNVVDAANERLQSEGSEYECLHYNGANSNKSIFKHVESGIEGESKYYDILSGKHPSWSPACKWRKNIDETIVNERLREANSEYECFHYDGANSPNSVFTHIPSGCTGKARFGNVLKGKHPSWPPACSKRNLSILSINQRLKKINSKYACVKYTGCDSPSSVFVHIPSGNSGQSKYDSIINGSHPSWSPR